MRDEVSVNRLSLGHWLTNRPRTAFFAVFCPFLKPKISDRTHPRPHPTDTGVCPNGENPLVGGGILQATRPSLIVALGHSFQSNKSPGWHGLSQSTTLAINRTQGGAVFAWGWELGKHGKRFLRRRERSPRMRLFCQGELS